MNSLKTDGRKSCVRSSVTGIPNQTWPPLTWNDRIFGFLYNFMEFSESLLCKLLLRGPIDEDPSVEIYIVDPSETISFNVMVGFKPTIEL